MKSLSLKYHGGKHYLAPWIISHMPPHLHYVEPYFGGGSVLFARDPHRDWFIDEAWRLKHGEKVPTGLKGCSEVVNDTNARLVNFWSVIRCSDLFEEFRRAVSLTPFSEEAWQIFHDVDVDPREGFREQSSHIDQAVWFFIRYRMSRQGLGKDFATISRRRTRRGMNEQVSSWLSAVEGLPEAHERLKRVAILNRDALDVIKQQDGEKTLFYLDPPYLHETRSSSGEYGEHEMREQDHAMLLLVLGNIKGKCLLSGYRSRLYDTAEGEYGWRRVEKQIDNKASSKAEKEIKTECLWMNY